MLSVKKLVWSTDKPDMSDGHHAYTSMWKPPLKHTERCKHLEALQIFTYLSIMQWNLIIQEILLQHDSKPKHTAWVKKDHLQQQGQEVPATDWHDPHRDWSTCEASWKIALTSEKSDQICYRFFCLSHVVQWRSVINNCNTINCAKCEGVWMHSMSRYFPFPPTVETNCGWLSNKQTAGPVICSFKLKLFVYRKGLGSQFLLHCDESTPVLVSFHFVNFISDLFDLGSN